MPPTRPDIAARIGLWLRQQLAADHMRFLVKRASAVFFAQIAGAAVAFLSGILLGRWLGPEAFGRYSYAITIIIVVRIAANLGLPMLTMRTVAIYQGNKDWPHLKGLLRYAAVSTVAGGVGAALLTAAVLIAFTPHAFSQTGLLTLMALPLLLFLPISETAAGAIRGLQHVSLGQSSELARSFLYLIALVLALLWFRDLTASSALILRIAAEALGAAVTLAVLLRLLPADLRQAPVRMRIFEWRKGQLSFIVLESMFIIYQQTSILMLGLMRPMAEVGVYRMAFNLSLVLTFASSIASVALGPLAASAWAAGKRDQLEDAATRLSRLAFALTLVLFVALLAVTPIIISILGPGFSGLMIPLVILGVNQVVRALMSAASMITLMTGSEATAAWGVAASALANIVLNAVLIPPFGMIGSAIAMLIATTILSLFYTVLAFRRTGIAGTVFGARHLAKLFTAKREP